MKFNLKTALGGSRGKVDVWVYEKKNLSLLVKTISEIVQNYACSIINVKDISEQKRSIIPNGAWFVYLIEFSDEKRFAEMTTEDFIPDSPEEIVSNCIGSIEDEVKNANGEVENNGQSRLKTFLDKDRQDWDEGQWGNATDDGEGFNLPDINAKRVFNFKKYADFGMHENDEGFYDFKRKMWEDARKNPSFGGDVDDAVAYRFDKHVDEMWSAMKKPYFVSIESFGDRANKSDIRTRNFATPEECEAYVEQYKGSVNQSEFYTFDKLLVKIEKYNGSGKGWTKVNEYEINLKEETPQAVPEFSEEQFAV